MGGRALLALVTVGAVGALSAAPAAADVPTVTGTAAVGGTLVVTDSDNTVCDGQSASVAIRRPTGPNTAVHITSKSTPLVEGVPWTISITIPPTDAGGTALTPGMQISVDAGGICNAFGDQFSFQYDEVLLTLGQPVTAPTTTTTAPAPTTTATTVPPTSPPTTAAATATAIDPSPTSVAAAATSGGAADATLPRTGASDLAATLVGLVALALGGVALLGSRRRPLRRS
jgi:LPXTG-motif cell wall-anchored protein